MDGNNSEKKTPKKEEEDEYEDDDDFEDFDIEDHYARNLSTPGFNVW